MTTPVPAALRVSDLVVAYGQIVAVDALSLEVPSGAIVAVLGANGAGKTSTLNALAGASVGSVRGSFTVFGRPARLHPAHRVVRSGVVLVPEGRHVFPPLTVADNLLVGGYTRRRAPNAATLAQVYELFPILHQRRNSPAGLLSGGEQQLLAFGRAMMSAPRLILMDEPSMGLAPVMVDRVMSAISAINARGTSILVVEQNAAAILQIAHYAYVLDRGRVTFEGAATAVRSNAIVVESFLGLGEEA